MKQLNKKSKRIVFFSIVIISILLAMSAGSMIPLAMEEGDGGGDDPDPLPDDDTNPPPPELVPNAPTLQSISPNPDPDGSVYLQWNAPTGATGYKIYMSKNSGTWQLIKTTSVIATVKSGLTNGAYRFKVQAYNAIGFSPHSNIRSVTISIPPPVILPPMLSPISPTTDTDGYITLSWSSVSGATAYAVYKNKDGGAWQLVLNTGATSKVVQISVNGNYGFKVKASGPAGTSGFSNLQSVTVSIPDPIQIPSAPILNTISPSVDYDGTILLDWNDVVGADAYKVYRNLEFGLVRLIASGVKESRYTDSVEVGKWYYRIEATNEAGDSPKSNYGEVTVSSGTDPDLLPETPVLNPIVPNPDIDGIITLSWSTLIATHFGISIDTLFIVPSPPGGISYDVFVCGVLIGSTTETTYTDEITLDGVYDYKIRARNAYGVSRFSNVESVVIDIYEEEEEEELVPDSPILNVLTYTIDGEEVEISLSWSVVDCNSYNVYKSVDGGSYVLIQSNLVLTTYSEVLTDVALYSYKITAENEHGVSELSNPTSITLTGGGGGVEDYTTIYVLLGVFGALTGITIITVILVKKKRNKL